jgi:hypothetical protein
MDSNKKDEQKADGEALDADVDALEDGGGAGGQTSEVPKAGSAADGTVDTTGGRAAGPADGAGAPKPKGVRRLMPRVSIYLLMMIVLLFVAVVIVMITYLTSKKTQPIASIPSQNLSASALEQLANGGVSVGNSNEILNIQSSAVFANKVLLRQDLEVAGNLQIGKALSLNDINVAGTAQVGDLQASKDLSVAGNSAVQGSATVGKSLQVGGGASFGGPVTAPQITASSLQLNGDLVLTHHLNTGGAAPGRSNGSALGGGGTSSVSGNDTSGAITINTGGGPSAGCLINVSFTSRFNGTPHVLITPVGSAAGGTSYYVNRSNTGFSVCVASPPPANTSFGYDYWVVN